MIDGLCSLWRLGVLPDDGRGDELGPGGVWTSRRVLEVEGGGTVLVLALVLVLAVEPYDGLAIVYFVSLPSV
jgi:hypothetical protein